MELRDPAERLRRYRITAVRLCGNPAWPAAENLMAHAQAPHFNRLRALPKAEVHAHLEGCFEPAVLEQWAAQARVPMPRPRERLFEFQGLADFLHFLDWACGLASTRERLAELSYSYSKRLADGGPATRT